jgi:hypothetical protein
MSDDYQSLFADALRSGDAAKLSRYLDDPTQIHRFAIYRNNVVNAAIEALRAAYPSVNRLVGINFFSSMARAYWDAHPINTRSLTLYGNGFPDHIAAYGPASNLPYLTDVARHDRAWLESHYAADCPVFEPSRATLMNPEELPKLAPGLDVSVRVQESSWPAYEIWRSNRFDDVPTQMKITPQPDQSLFWRHRGEVHHRSLSRAACVFYASMRDGASLERAGGAALDQDGSFDTAEEFGFALGNGLLAGGS